MDEGKLTEIDDRLAATRASLMVYESVIVAILDLLSQREDLETLKKSLAAQLEAEADRFAAMPADSPGCFPAIADALRHFAAVLAHLDRGDTAETWRTLGLRVVPGGRQN